MNYHKSELFLKDAREQAKKTGYDPSKLSLANDNKHKLVYDSPYGKKKFGLLTYGDFLYYKRFNPVVAEQKRNRFRASHERISKIYQLDKYSPNELAINILW
jgi:hypothetical protein